MVYDLKTEFDQKRAVEKLEFLIKNCKIIELTEKRQRRSISQNAYLHLILSFFALEYGESVNFIKQEMFKKIVNKDIFLGEYANFKTGEMRPDWRSTADLNTKEMTDAIDRFRNYASKEAGVYLPEPKDLSMLQEIENKIKNNNQYL